MSVTYGFFNSINSDRVYNADQMSTYFKGLVSDGVYESVGGALQVLASSTPDMNVNVQTGRAIINSKWLENDAVETLAITTASASLNRWTAVCVHLDITNRLIELVTIDGTAASSPTKPTISNSSTDYYLVLAWVYVGAAVTTITQSVITDARADTDVCGWVTGLIDQVDTSTLFTQWQTAYETYYNTMTAAFESWYENLTGNLSCNTYIEQYEKTVTITSSSSKIVALDMDDYEYDSSDIFIISFNGMLAVEVYDYLFDTSTDPVEVHLNLVNATKELVNIRVLKSKIGFTELATAASEIVVTDSDETVVTD